ncbi:MAG TPA: hypothetical protein VI895_11475 [Bdellovibrionota bacterium]|nr:hypothetical protein [Bdellovibrionota bacterium]
MKKVFFTGLAIFGLLYVGACSDDDAPASTTTLTETQAEAVASAVGEGTGAAVQGGGFGRLAVRSQGTGSAAVDGTFTCEGGGSISTAGTTTVNEFTQSSASADYGVTSTFNDCIVQTEEGDNLTLSGSVTNNGGFDFTFSETSIGGSVSADITGNIDVSGDNVTSGTCGVSISVNSTIADNVVNSTASGSVCGQSVSFSETDTID